jgi:hypothetical protein
VTHKGVVEVPVFLTEWAVKLNAIPSNTIRMKAKSINVNSLKQPVPLQAMLNATNAPKVGVVAVWNPGFEIEDSEVMYVANCIILRRITLRWFIYSFNR